MDGYSDGGNDDAYGDDGGYGDNIPTRDFLSRPATFSSAAPYNPNAFGMPSSSSLNPSRLDFGGLDLNSGSDWAAMLGYEDLLRSGGVDGSHGPPPVRVPGRSGRGTLGLRGARGGRHASRICVRGERIGIRRRIRVADADRSWSFIEGNPRRQASRRPSPCWGKVLCPSLFLLMHEYFVQHTVPFRSFRTHIMCRLGGQQ
jgi:hypothetical protein